jgi:amino-acid N-acetyltransferase
VLRLTPAKPEDLDGIRVLLRTANLPTDDVGPTLLPGFVILREADSIVGAAAIEPLSGCALLRSVVVADIARGRGEGTRLTQAAEQLAAKHGLSPLYLLTTSAAKFFVARGFREVRREDVPAEVKASREFSTLCPDTAQVLVKP